MEFNGIELFHKNQYLNRPFPKRKIHFISWTKFDFNLRNKLNFPVSIGKITNFKHFKSVKFLDWITSVCDGKTDQILFLATKKDIKFNYKNDFILSRKERIHAIEIHRTSSLCWRKWSSNWLSSKTSNFNYFFLT